MLFPKAWLKSRKHRQSHRDVSSGSVIAVGRQYDFIQDSDSISRVLTKSRKGEQTNRNQQQAILHARKFGLKAVSQNESKQSKSMVRCHYTNGKFFALKWLRVCFKGKDLVVASHVFEISKILKISPWRAINLTELKVESVLVPGVHYNGHRQDCRWMRFCANSFSRLADDRAEILSRLLNPLSK